MFGDIRVFPTIRGETRVEWVLLPTFNDAGPYEFQLQVGRTANPEADDWEAVGATVTDTYYALDDVSRVYGKTQWTHYRICLQTATGTYLSSAVSALGVLPTRFHKQWRSSYRAWEIELRKNIGQEGYLLKKRHFGAHCSCNDFQTETPTDPKCPECYGSGFVGGYFDPLPCHYVALENKASKPDRDDQRGPVNDALVVPGKVLAVPQLYREDVWVDAKNDHRWEVWSMQSLVDVHNLPVVLQAEFRQLPFSHPAYQFPVEGRNA